MAWRGVHLSRKARLSTADGQIVVAQDDGEVRLPLEDVAYLILDTPQATLTTTLLSACMEAGIVVISVDDRHTPNGIMLPFHSHHRQAGMAAAQLAVSEPFRKRCWQRIVTAKIENQAAHLAACGRPGAAALVAMARRVGSGDPDNVEARAARDYWRALFDRFVRDDPADLRNKLLNYGYAVMRASIARALVAHGLLPSMGLNHASVTNAFNLADDLIEPFRPFVDRLGRARSEGREPSGGLTIEDRRAMAGILLQDCVVANRDRQPLGGHGKGCGGIGPGHRGQQPGASSSAAAGGLDGPRSMKAGEVRYMWLFVFFDLPVRTKVERRDATRFRKFLKDDGFMMLQLSVYSRVIRGEEAVEKHLLRVTKNLPPKGSVRTLTVTERQYARMKLLIGEPAKNEKVAPQQLVLL